MKTKIMFAALILVLVIGGILSIAWFQRMQMRGSEEAGIGHGPMGLIERLMGQETEVSHEWTEQEIETLRTLWIESLPPLPPDPSNQYADDPQAAALGHKLFFDTRFSSNGQVSCATCHIPELMFTDGRALAVGVGINNRKTMTIVGASYSPWQFWDGRADSQWAQALGPLENPVEHGGTRAQYVHLIDQHYHEEYEAVFGPLPDLTDRTRFPANAGPVEDPESRTAWEAMRPEDRETVNRIYANMGKAIAAYERLIVPGPSRFDVYVEALLKGDEQAMEEALTTDEVNGLRLFIGDANCIKCHNGPLFTDNAFHNTGIPPRIGEDPDPGRQGAINQVLENEFNCLGPYSDAEPEQCVQLNTLEGNGEALAGAFKPPTLRNVAKTAPYMHAGQFGDLFMVVRHYRHPPQAAIGQTELETPVFMHTGMLQLQAFLNSLSGPLTTPAELLAAPQD